MSKRLVNILYDPAFVSCCAVSKTEGPPPSPQNIPELKQSDQRVLSLLEELIQATRETDIETLLMRFCLALHFDMTPGMRPVLLKEFNLFLSRMVAVFFNARRLYQGCLQTIIEFKNIISQANGSMGQAEWVELEKSIYLLSMWETELEKATGEEQKSLVVDRWS